MVDLDFCWVLLLFFNCYFGVVGCTILGLVLIISLKLFERFRLFFRACGNAARHSQIIGKITNSWGISCPSEKRLKFLVDFLCHFNNFLAFRLVEKEWELCSLLLLLFLLILIFILVTLRARCPSNKVLVQKASIIDTDRAASQILVTQ